MHNVFFKGRIEVREKYQRFGYNTNRQVKLGSANSPLILQVNSVQRKSEIESVLLDNSLVANIEVNPNEQENIIQLDTILNKPIPQSTPPKFNRNDSCHCGSGKKVKKCCGV
jgi:SWIM/SEC-C metal-binding protein